MAKRRRRKVKKQQPRVAKKEDGAQPKREDEDIAKPLACDLPGEIIMDILSWLLVKCLVQCKCIFKGWHVLVKNLFFILMHSRKSALRNDECYLVLRRHKYCKVTETLLLHDEENVCRQTCVAHQSTYCLVGACNGLRCVTSKVNAFGDAYMLLNPATREFKPAFKYGTPEEARSKPPQILTLGFGFDSMTNDYKIVIASNRRRDFLPKEYWVQSWEEDEFTNKDGEHLEEETLMRDENEFHASKGNETEETSDEQEFKAFKANENEELTNREAQFEKIEQSENTDCDDNAQYEEMEDESIDKEVKVHRGQNVNNSGMTLKFSLQGENVVGSYFFVAKNDVCCPQLGVENLLSDTGWVNMETFFDPEERQEMSKGSHKNQVFKLYNADVNGFLHWLAIKQNGRLIISFDLRREVFGEITLPPVAHEPFHSRLGVWKGGLAVMSFFDDPSIDWGCEIWSLSDGAWQKDLIIHPSHREFVLLGSRANKIMFARWHSETLHLYNQNDETTTSVGLPGPVSIDVDVVDYRESLVKLSGAKILSETTEISARAKGQGRMTWTWNHICLGLVGAYVSRVFGLYFRELAYGF
ncbi:hypothetical protein RJ640_002596 [Escallonia rubra]|uniref:F-box domain-containing protein n=1 Tax=Escallonia rubra TaxID=112253 RepID=A0AA88R292_9ASTE|nr:hypothetical protein RJ640_002596 [Escallonia rubra]